VVGGIEILCDGRHGFFPDLFGMEKLTFNQFCMMKPYVVSLCLPHFADCFFIGWKILYHHITSTEWSTVHVLPQRILHHCR